jgi:hypothetical protein
MGYVMDKKLGFIFLFFFSAIFYCRENSFAKSEAAISDVAFATLRIQVDSASPSVDPRNLEGSQTYNNQGTPLPFSNRQLSVFEIGGGLLATSDFYDTHELRLATSKSYAVVVNGSGIRIDVDAEGNMKDGLRNPVTEIKIHEYTVESPSTSWSLFATDRQQFTFAPGVRVAFVEPYTSLLTSLLFVVPATTSFDDAPIDILYQHDFERGEPTRFTPKLSGKITLEVPSGFQSWDDTSITVGATAPNLGFSHKTEKNMWFSHLAFSHESLDQESPCKKRVNIFLKGYATDVSYLCQPGVDVNLRFARVLVKSEQANWTSAISPRSNPGGVDFLTHSEDTMSVRYLDPYNVNIFVQPKLSETVEIGIPPILVQIFSDSKAKISPADVLTITEQVSGYVDYSGPLAQPSQSINKLVPRTSPIEIKLNGTTLVMATSGKITQQLPVYIGAISENAVSTKSYDIYQQLPQGEIKIASNLPNGMVVNVLPGTYRLSIQPNVIGASVESRAVVVGNETGLTPVQSAGGSFDPALAGTWEINSSTRGNEWLNFSRVNGSGEYQVTGWNGSTIAHFYLTAVVDTSTLPNRIVVSVKSNPPPRGDIWHRGDKLYGIYSITGKTLLLNWSSQGFPEDSGADVYTRVP